MSEEPDMEVRRAIAEQAALWMLTVQSETLSPKQRAELAAWLRESPLHIAEMLRVCKLHRHMAGYKGWRRMAPVDWDQSSKILHFQPRRSGHKGMPLIRTRGTRPWRNTWRVAVGMAVLGAIGLTILTNLHRTEFATEPGERRELTLPDGSLAELAPNTDIVLRFRQHERLIELERGEATFHVTKNPNRPFLVRAAQTRILAVGTVFNVERDARAVSVAVIEGRVAVSQQPAARLLSFAPEPSVRTLSLGVDEQVSITLAGVTLPVHKVEHAGAGSAQSAELTFEDQTVAEIARRFNLHNRIHIDILDSQLGARRITGVFRADDPHSFVDFIRATTEVQVIEPDATHITLSLTMDRNGATSR